MMVESRSAVAVFVGAVLTVSGPVSGLVPGAGVVTDPGAWTIVPEWNAIPSGPASDVNTERGCEDLCSATPGCVQWTWNYGHKPKYYCFLSNNTEWAGSENDHITSGCLAAKVDHCGQLPPRPPLPPRSPKWEVKTAPNGTKPFCGFTMATPAEGLITTVVYKATLDIGAYNHAAMFDFHNGTFLLTWKNSPVDEDTPGQRILYSQSADGAQWTVTDGHNILFPNMSSATHSAALFGGPTAILNGRRYATASPHQFCLFPYPYAANVTSEEDTNVLLMRRVGSGIPAALGPIFWASTKIPLGFEAASVREGVVPSSQMDAETRADLAALAETAVPPCGGAAAPTAGTLKCEACIGGCGTTTRCERTHYTVPAAGGGGDVILERSHDQMLTFSFRNATSDPWSVDTPSTLPDVNANLNAGALPNGRVFLASNPCPDNQEVHGRDPLVISTSADGFTWDTAVGVMSCKQLEQCGPRYPGRAKGPGPSYPQAVTVLDPPQLAGLWVTATNNKEDVVVVKVPFPALEGKPPNAAV